MTITCISRVPGNLSRAPWNSTTAQPRATGTRRVPSPPPPRSQHPDQPEQGPQPRRPVQGTVTANRARWLTKTILTAQLAMTARSEQGILYPQDYQTFFSHAQPFNNQFTLMWSYQGTLLPIRFEIHSPDEASNQGARALFHFHRLILVAYFMPIEKPTSIIIPHGFADGCHLLWPSQRGLLGSGDPTLSVGWPPPYRVDAAGVDAIRAAMTAPDRPESAPPPSS